MLYWEGQRDLAVDECRQISCAVLARATDLFRIEQWFNTRVDVETTIEGFRVLGELVSGGLLPQADSLYIGAPGNGVLYHSHPPDDGPIGPHTLLEIHPDGNLMRYLQELWIGLW